MHDVNIASAWNLSFMIFYIDRNQQNQGFAVR